MVKADGLYQLPIEPRPAHLTRAIDESRTVENIANLRIWQTRAVVRQRQLLSALKNG